jgi:heat shock protein HslJ
MRPHRALTPVLLLTATVTLVACGDTSSPGSPDGSSPLDLVGLTYVGSAVTVDGAPYPLVKGSTIRLTFSDGSIGASAGCNQLGGDASWDDGMLKAPNLFMTEMGCSAPLMRQDTWLADFLSSEPTLTQDADTLTLTSDGTVITLTDEEVAVPDVALTGTKWQLDTIITGETASSVPAGVVSTLMLGEDGRAQVRPGCNTGNGAFTVAGPVITFDPIALTAMACEGARTQVETTVMSVLDGDVDFSVDGTTLTLTPPQPTPDGTTSLIYRAR